MKLFTGLFIMCVVYSAQAQEPETHQELQETIETFFEGFHERDSLVMKSVTSEDVVMQTIGKDDTGEAVVHQEDFNKFLRSIVEIPLETSFREELHSFEFRIDEDMANVWTPYSLFMNETFSHCGVNSFQLMKKEGEWEIFYIVDSRRKEGCEIIE